MKILCNMAFWQSPTWTAATDSIYHIAGNEDPPPLSPIREAWLLFLNAGKYDAVVTMGSRASFCYGLLMALTARPSKQIFTEVFLDEQKETPFWRIKLLLWRWIAKRSLGVLTNSSPEVTFMTQRLNLPAERVLYVPMHTNIQQPALAGQNGGYIFSAGRSGRDYPTLINALTTLKQPAVIVAGSDDTIPTLLPAHIKVLREIDRNKYLDLLSHATLVAVPLHDTPRSTGQVVILEAMAMGKPVVATRAAGTIDHVMDKHNGRLVTPNSAKEWASVLQELLNQPETAKQLGQQGLQDVLEKWTIERHAKNKLWAIHQLPG